MEKKTYSAFLFRQRPKAPLQVAFVAPSSEIDAWARVPTKKMGNIRNFQRAEIPTHVNEISGFFSKDKNSSPTALVVGFDPFRGKGRVTIRTTGNIGVGDILLPILGEIDIEWHSAPDPESREDKLQFLKARTDDVAGYVLSELGDITGLDRPILERLAANVAKALDEGLLPSDSDVLEPGLGAQGDEEGTADDEEDETDDVAEGGFTLVPEDIRAAITKPLTPGDHAILQGRLRFVAELNPDRLQSASNERLDGLFDEVVQELKPALIIDGQHRVEATKLLGEIPFLVTALPNSDWSELAFQFIVTNHTAKKVPESLLISIVGNSLSKTQREDLEERLRNAKIRVGLIEAVMLIHESEDSPFYGTLAFGLKKEKGFLEAPAMQSKVVKPWFEREAFRKGRGMPVRELFDHLCKGRTKGDRTEYWKEEGLWYEYLSAFWRAVRTRYEGSDVFSPETQESSFGGRVATSKLMRATVLGIFQKTVLQSLYGYLQTKERIEEQRLVDAWATREQFEKLVASQLKALTPEFFQGWTMTGLDASKETREHLAHAIREVISNGKTVTELKNGRDPLFYKGN
jgi:hypothetical protein